MNWNQLHNSATPEERLELLIHMMQTVEERQQRVVFTGLHWVRNRRQGYKAHFLNDRRRSRLNVQRAASLITFGVVLVSVSAATVAMITIAPSQISGPILFFYVTSLWGVLAFRPKRQRFFASLRA